MAQLSFQLLVDPGSGEQEVVVRERPLGVIALKPRLPEYELAEVGQHDAPVLLDVVHIRFDGQPLVFVQVGRGVRLG